uniref:MAK10-like protein n=1 Tax=Tanacetum cinerariifolium TaxID=118510 RepID=A0A699H4K4_TANCI|nr:hypothetical protein [Tanacetum cinerariifolium]
MGDANPICTLSDYSKPSQEGYRNTIELLEGNNVNDPIDFAKSVKAISLPQDVSSTSDCSLIELENQVQRLIEAHITSMQPTQVNKITSLCKIRSGPLTLSTAWKISSKLLLNMHPRILKKREASQDARLSKFEADFKPQQSKMTNKINTVLKAITNRMAGALPSDTVKNPKLNDNYLLALTQQTQQPKEPERTLEDEFKDLHLSLSVLEILAHAPILLEETNHVPGLADGTKSYPIGIVRDVEVHIVRLKLLIEFYVIDMKKDPETPLLVGRGFLATANAVIDCRKAKIAIGEKITRSYLMRRSLEVLRKFY